MFLRNPTLVVLLCNAVAWGLIQPVMEKDPSVQGVALEAALQDVRKALEVCQCAHVRGGWALVHDLNVSIHVFNVYQTQRGICEE